MIYLLAEPDNVTNQYIAKCCEQMNGWYGCYWLLHTATPVPNISESASVVYRVTYRYFNSHRNSINYNFGMAYEYQGAIHFSTE